MTDLTQTWLGPLSLILFLMAYILVVMEEKIHMRKSKPVIFGGCLIWMFIGIYEAQHGHGNSHEFVKELIGEIGELFFFLLAAMTYINTMAERNVFNKLRVWLLQKV